jgi:hypothetical protein
MHVDADEVHLPPSSGKTLAQAIAQVDMEGYNAINFLEFTFIPVQEAPNHDHPNFRQTMRWYYPFLPSFPHRLNAWKTQQVPVELVWSGGHQVRFPNLRMYPESFLMLHYLFLSVPHAIHKYSHQCHDPEDVKAGWGTGWRSKLRPETIQLPSQRELYTFTFNAQLDSTNPRKRHYLDNVSATTEWS